MEPATKNFSLAEALAFLYGRIDYERTAAFPAGSAELQLERMRDLLERLGNPHHGMSIAHLAGTKGKGSTAALLGEILTAAGYRTGIFSSPHLERLEERMSIDGNVCPSAELVEMIDHLRPAVGEMDVRQRNQDGGPTFFEITTALAMLHFRRNAVDFAIFEVGMGGRLDSTNVCDPLVSVITSISLDHTTQLGNTLGQIAREKAGIIKPGIPVISGVADPEPRGVIRQIAAERDCHLTELGRDFHFGYQSPNRWDLAEPIARMQFRSTTSNWEPGDLQLRLLGQHQAANAALAIATAHQLIESGLEITEHAIRRGLRQARIPARIELVGIRPFVIVDAAHNVASIQALVETIRAIPCRGKRQLIFAATRDKDVRGMLPYLLEQFDELVFTCYQKNPRGADPLELKRTATELLESRTIGTEGLSQDSMDAQSVRGDSNQGSGFRIGTKLTTKPQPAAAWEYCRSSATRDDLICISGSFFLAAEMRSLARGE
jgi:dihydrofolate synthase/folylpolyglutamate synthase